MFSNGCKGGIHNYIVLQGDVAPVLLFAMDVLYVKQESVSSHTLYDI